MRNSVAGYAVTAAGGYRTIVGDMALQAGEQFFESIPSWALELALSTERNESSNSQLVEKITAASMIIQTLQDSFDIGEISEVETRKLMLWKRYRIALAETPDQFGWPATPDWPAPPEP